MEVEITQTTTTTKKVTKRVSKTEMEITPQEMSQNKMFASDPYDDVDIEDLLEQLSPDELQLLADDVDPDDPCIPPSERCAYKCEKTSTGPLDRKKLITHINDKALNEPDKLDCVPYVAGTVRGKKWVAPPPPEVEENDDAIEEVEVDLDDEFAAVLTATEDEIVDLAAILGFHSMMNQDQYHASLLNKGKPLGVGWGGVTKATKFKALPMEAPNDLDSEASIKRLSDNDDKCKELNFNNIRNLSDEALTRLFGALEMNTKLEYLSMANTGISDRHLDTLCNALSENRALRTINLETNNITPGGTVRLLEAVNKNHAVEEIRLANQRQSVMGNKIEMALTNLIEANPSILRVGVHFEFNDARNRVSRHLQKNLDTFRIEIPINAKKNINRKTSTEAASLSFTLSQQPGTSPLPEDDEDLSSSSSEDEDDVQRPLPPKPPTAAKPVLPVKSGFDDGDESSSLSESSDDE